MSTNDGGELKVVNNDEALTQAVDLAADLGEIALDQFLKDGPLKDVPFVGSLVKMWRGTVSLRDSLFLKKLLRFLASAQVDGNERQQFLQKLQTDSDFRRDTGLHLCLVLERLDDIEKADVLAALFASFVVGNITRDDFRRLSGALDRAHLPDLKVLRDVVRGQGEMTGIAFAGLEGAGLAFVYHSITRSKGTNDITGRVGNQDFILSPLAIQMAQHGFR